MMKVVYVPEYNYAVSIQKTTAYSKSGLGTQFLLSYILQKVVSNAKYLSWTGLYTFFFFP